MQIMNKIIELQKCVPKPYSQDHVITIQKSVSKDKNNFTADGGYKKSLEIPKGGNQNP